MNPSSVRRFTVTDTPYNFGPERRRIDSQDVRKGDVVSTSATRTDPDGDYFCKVERTGRHFYISAAVLTPVVEPTEVKVSAVAVRKALEALGASAKDSKRVVKLAQAIEAGI